MRPAVRPAIPRLEAVLFDMDGLLVDSEPVWYEVERDVMAGFGVDWTPEQGAGLVGNPLPVSARLLLDAAGVDGDAHALAAELVEAMARRLQDAVPWKPGALELRSALAAAGLPLALVSSSYRRLVDTVLAHLPIGAFDATVAGDEVDRPKPDPQPYLEAAGLLGVDPRHCVVLEDSPTGVASGEAAGARVVAVPDLRPVLSAPGRTVLRSLVGVTPADLGAADGAAASPRKVSGTSRIGNGRRTIGPQTGAGDVFTSRNEQTPGARQTEPDAGAWGGVDP